MHQDLESKKQLADRNCSVDIYKPVTGASWYSAGYDGLIVDPCLPETFGDFKVNRHFRGADYHIEIHKPKGVQKGVRWIEVDGERINGNQIPMVNGRNEYHVIVQMG